MLKKIEAIQKYPEPKKLKELRAFLGLSGYYRRFVKNYAKLAKPLTKLLRGEECHHGHDNCKECNLKKVTKHNSKTFLIKLDEEAKRSFELLKQILTSEDVLSFPNFEKPFILTTDASDKAIGAALSQQFSDGERSITFISRTLSKTEENSSMGIRSLKKFYIRSKNQNLHRSSTSHVYNFTQKQQRKIKKMENVYRRT